MAPSLSTEVSGKLTEDETPVRRNSKFADALVTQPFEGVETVTDVLLYSARQWGTKDALGTRDVLSIVEEEKEVKKGDGKTEKKLWKYFELGPYKYMNFIEVKDRATKLAMGLLELGVEKGAVFNIYAQTAANWQLMQHACSMISTTIATAYDTLGESGLTHALNEPSCMGVFTNADLLPTLTNVLPNAPSVKLVVYDGKPSDAALSKLKEIRDGALKLLHIDELAKLGEGKSEDAVKARYPNKDTVSCIMYTSGSTGAPKGVVLTHLNLISALGAVTLHSIGEHLHSTDSFLAFLPLSHILAYIVELTLYSMGVTIGYGRVRTLVDTSVRKCRGDIREFKPTIMIGVPAVWETIRKGILGKVNSSGALKKGVFNSAIGLKKLSLPGVNSVVDATVLGVVKEQTGGRLRLALSGGAALSRETQEFLTLALVTVLQGYGLTESCGMCAILAPQFFKYGTAGSPVGSIEIKLLSHPEANYWSTNNPPQGEILIRGPSVTKGYYKREDLNNDRSIFTEDGWFRTGDVGQWNPDGTLSIIDRIKNLVKLSGGEYIALERLESTYKSCHLVSNICVHADTDAKQPIAIIVPHEANLRQTLKSQSSPVASHSLPEICKDQSVQALILKECNAAGKKAGFKPMETLQGVVLTAEEWTPESGLVTAAQKIQRKKIGEVFASEIKNTYKKSQGSD